MPNACVMPTPEPTLEDTGLFLQRFHAGKDRYGLVFFPRESTFQGLIDLEITAGQRESALNELVPEQCTGGPYPDNLLPIGKVWEFETHVNGKRTFIRLSLGLEDNAVFCLAFGPKGFPDPFT